MSDEAVGGDIVERDEGETTPAPVGENSPEKLISQAIERGVDVETMERLLAMRRELKEEQAKKAYFDSLAAFQSECPQIKKTKEVYHKGSLRYRYAPLDDILRQVRELLRKHGFSYTLETRQDESGTPTAVVCTVHHTKGHSESAQFPVVVDPEAHMNAQQKVASAHTYAKRYAFCAALGILTSDEDDDAIASGDDSGSQGGDSAPSQPRSKPSSGSQSGNGGGTEPAGAWTRTAIAEVEQKKTKKGSTMYRVKSASSGKWATCFDTALGDELERYAGTDDVIDVYVSVDSFGPKIEAGAVAGEDLAEINKARHAEPEPTTEGEPEPPQDQTGEAAETPDEDLPF